MRKAGRINHRPSSPTLSTFAPSKILPSHEFSMEDLNLAHRQFGPVDSAHDLDIIGQGDGMAEEDFAETSDPKRFSEGAISQYDLAAPPPRFSHADGEYLAERLFSPEHLTIILKDPVSLQRFTGFLNRYRPHSAPTLVRYLESQKAMTAIRYANALASQISMQSHQSPRSEAAQVDAWFEGSMRRALDELVSDALPAYITHQMVMLVTEVLVKEITGNNTPLMKEMVQGLAEVYCMSDPSLPDNPIVFASEEFYNTTQYGQQYVIGKNCRFLQGPNTQQAAVKRISDALHNDTEVCEILLNYRRDGSPFLNLVMMAPLLDHHGKSRYVLGCQIDITHLIEGGRGLNTFKQLLAKDPESGDKPLPDPFENKPPLKLLRDFGNQLNDEEIDAFQARGQGRGPRSSMDSERSTPNRPPGPSRLFVGMDDPGESSSFWPSTQFGSSGRLPGVYQNYLLVRPYPSLRIIFTSATLRIPGLSQSRLMDRIGGPAHVREGLMDALARGIGVTAKISWLTKASDRSPAPQTVETRPSSMASTSSTDSLFVEGKPRWIHCTPLLGSDAKPGVIMIVMVDREEITGGLNRERSLRPASPVVMRTNPESWPLHGRGLGTWNVSSKMYADYLRREGKDDGSLAPRAVLSSDRSDSLSHSRSLRSRDRERRVDGLGSERGIWSERIGEENGSGSGREREREREREEARSRRSASASARRTPARNGGTM